MKVTKKTRLLERHLPNLVITARSGGGVDPHLESYLRFECPDDPAAIKADDRITLEWTADGEATVTKSVCLYQAPEGDFLICDNPFTLDDHWDFGYAGTLVGYNDKCRGSFHVEA